MKKKKTKTKTVWFEVTDYGLNLRSFGEYSTKEPKRSYYKYKKGKVIFE